jgi:hypothetical protein
MEEEIADEPPAFELIDAFPAFQAFRKASRGELIEGRLRRWETEYISQWPELKEKLIEE